jgi:hypothetical protein
MLPPFAARNGSLKGVPAALPPAFALAFVSSVSILITSRVVGHFRGRHRRMRPSDADAELSAHGAANSIASLFGAALSVGIPARSLAVVRCGGTTAIANLVHAVVLMAIRWLGSICVAHAASRPGRRDRVDGRVPPQLERVAPSPEDVARRRGRVPGDGVFPPRRKRSLGGSHGLLAVSGPRLVHPP